MINEFLIYCSLLKTVAVVVGILFSDLVGFILGENTRWRYMFLLIAALGVPPLLMKSFLLESPRWLLEKNADSPHARFVIKKLRGFRYDEEIETEVDHFLGASKSQSLEEDGDGSTTEPKNVTAELFADKSVRLLLVTSMVFQVAQQLCGINAVFVSKPGALSFIRMVYILFLPAIVSTLIKQNTVLLKPLL